MQVFNTYSEDEQMGSGRMREEDRNDNAVVKALGGDSEGSILSVRGEDRGEASHKEVAVAVTTAPRQECTLVYCLASIESCGWAPIVFAEPGSTETDYQTNWNKNKLGIWHNWLNASRWCLENTSSEYIMTVQDDSLFHPESKLLVDRMYWPSDAGFVSLYTPKHYSVKRPVGINKIRTKSLWGACALLWSRSSLSAVVDTPTARNWLGAPPKSKSKSVIESRRNNPSMIANSDTAIGKAMNRLELGMYFIDPSPVHHIARFSTISHGDNTGRRNCGRCSDFDKPLWEQVYA